MGSSPDVVEVPRPEWERLTHRLARLEQKVAELEPGAAPMPVPALPASPTEVDAARAVSRRRAMGSLAGAAAGAVAATVATASPAAATNGDALLLGNGGTQNCTGPTGVSVLGTASGYGLGFSDNGYTGSLVGFVRPAAWLHAREQAFRAGLLIMGEGNATGVIARVKTGVALDALTENTTCALFQSNAAPVATFSSAIRVATNNIGVGISANRSHLFLTAHNGATVSAPPSRTTAHESGEVVGDSDSSGTQSSLWYCVRRGTPGTWRKLAGPQTAGSYHLLPTPVRIYDSRPGTTPAQGPKTPLPAGNVARTIDCTHNGSGVPAGATGVVLTVLLASAASGNGNLTIWANGAAKPASNTMVWGGSAGRFTTLAMAAVDGLARISIGASLSTHVILDVVGYYR